MDIAYVSTTTRLKVGSESDFQNLARPSFSKKWYLGIDASSTSYGVAIYTKDYSDVHLFIFFRGMLETADSFREIMYGWLQRYLSNTEFATVTYERTPEGYKPPSSHAEKVMRDTEAAVKNFVYDSNYLMTAGKDYIFDIFPNTWKYFSVPKSRENLGKVDKRQNAISVLESCGLNVETWIRGFDSMKLSHDYDCFEALGVGRYGSHFLLQDDGTVKIYKNFTKIGNTVVACKRVESVDDMAEELEFIGRFGSNKIPRLCTINENHSVPENLLGLYDKEFNNILIVPADSEFAIYLDVAFKFDLSDSRDYLIVGTRTTKTDVNEDVCRKYGYNPIYI